MHAQNIYFTPTLDCRSRVKPVNEPLLPACLPAIADEEEEENKIMRKVTDSLNNIGFFKAKKCMTTICIS